MSKPLIEQYGTYFNWPYHLGVVLTVEQAERALRGVRSIIEFHLGSADTLACPDRIACTLMGLRGTRYTISVHGIAVITSDGELRSAIGPGTYHGVSLMPMESQFTGILLPAPATEVATPTQV